MARRPDESRFEYYTADFRYARGMLMWFWLKLLAYGGMVYGVVTLRAYYAVLGLVAVLLLRWLERNDAEEPKD